MQVDQPIDQSRQFAPAPCLELGDQIALVLPEDPARLGLGVDQLHRIPPGTQLARQLHQLSGAPFESQQQADRV